MYFIVARVNCAPEKKKKYDDEAASGLTAQIEAHGSLVLGGLVMWKFRRNSASSVFGSVHGPTYVRPRPFRAHRALVLGREISHEFVSAGDIFWPNRNNVTL